MKLECPWCRKPLADHTKRLSDTTGDPNDERIICSDNPVGPVSFGPEDILRIADEQLADFSRALDAIDEVMSYDKGMGEEDWVAFCNNTLPLVQRHGRQQYTVGWFS